MKTATPELKAHYASSGTTITTCWKVSRRDGKQFGFTALDRDVIVQGFRYSATVGVAADAINSSNDFSVQNVEVSGLLQEGLLAIGAMTEEDILAGVWDDARITIFEVNWMDPSAGVWTLQQVTGKTVSPGCWKDLGSVECGVDLSLFTYTGAVESTSDGSRNWKDSSLGQADHFFRYGKVRWLTGENVGQSMEVKDSANTGEIELQLDMPDVVSVGDTYTISAGCNKLLKSAETVYALPVSGSVTGGAGTGETFTDSSKGELDHYWIGARITWTGGANIGQVMEVQDFAGGNFTLLGTTDAVMANGDTFQLEAVLTTGDAVYTGDCKVKFDNVLNHGGFAEVPGNDRAAGAAN